MCLMKCVCFRLPDIPVSIALVDSFSFFKVNVEAHNPMYPKVCPKIREAIFSGVEAAARALRYNNSKPKAGIAVASVTLSHLLMLPLLPLMMAIWCALNLKAMNLTPNNTLCGLN